MYALISVISVCSVQCHRCPFSAKPFEPFDKYIFSVWASAHRSMAEMHLVSHRILSGDRSDSMLLWPLQCYCILRRTSHPFLWWSRTPSKWWSPLLRPLVLSLHLLALTTRTVLEGAYRLQVSVQVCPKLNKLWECVETEWQEPLCVTSHIWGLQTSLEQRGSLLSCARAQLNSMTCGLPGTWFC